MARVEKSFQSIRTLSVVASIAFPIFIIFFVTHQNSIFDILQEFNVLIEGTKNKISQPNAGKSTV